MKDQKEKLKKQSISSRKIIILHKEEKDLYSENCKMLMKESKMIQTDEKIYHVLGLEDSTVKND